jgi:hypothetical protein
MIQGHREHLFTLVIARNLKPAEGDEAISISPHLRISLLSFPGALFVIPWLDQGIQVRALRASRAVEKFLICHCERSAAISVSSFSKFIGIFDYVINLRIPHLGVRQ